MVVALSLKAQNWHVRRFGRYSTYCDDVVCVQHAKGVSYEDERYEDGISHMIYRKGIR